MGFGSSPGMIYATQQIGGVNRRWHESDIFRKLGRVSALGFRWDNDRHVLIKDGPFTVGIETPWVHAEGSHKNRCGFDHFIAFNEFKIISPKCLNCWKVCVGLPTFASLMRMEEIQSQMPDGLPCKCGIEVRDYTPKEYGAYFYAHSLEEGRDMYEDVCTVIKKNMEGGKKIAKGAILKRGCTEFEMVKGPSNFWHLSDQERDVYELLDSVVEDRRSHAHQDRTIKNYVKQNWLLWAHSHGDMTYLPWNDNRPLFPGYVSYHKGDIEDIKKDLAKSVDMAKKANVPTPPVQEPIDMDTVEEYASEVIGDQDELT